MPRILDEDDYEDDSRPLKPEATNAASDMPDWFKGELERAAGENNPPLTSARKPIRITVDTSSAKGVRVNPIR